MKKRFVYDDGKSHKFWEIEVRLKWVADTLAAGREPASSSPSAFEDMPGRAKRSR